ncbi:MAG: hypothetical protein U0670_19215 [Anaerolineae bacterium]
MAPTIELIQLETTDDSTSVRDRLSFLRGRHVLLIWPEQGTVLTRKLDLVLIQREAARLMIRLALVTHDPVVFRNAAELDISAFETIGSAKRAKWRRPRTKVFTNRDQRPADAQEPDELAPIVSRLRVEDISPAQRRARLIARVVIVLILVTVTGAIGYVIAPSATVTIIPTRTQTEVTASIQANPTIGQGQIDVENHIIPAITLRVEIEEHAAVETSGTRSLGATSAVGSVVFINTTSVPVDIPAGTFVSTSAGTPIIFRTTQAGQVAGGIGLQIEIPVQAVAESSGEIGNIEPGLINQVIGALSTQVQVRNFSATYGGTSQAIRVVSEDDRTRLLDTIRQQIQSRAYTEMQPRISPDQIIIPETIRITEERQDWMTFDAEVGDEANSLSLTMRAVVEATAVDMRLAQQIAYVQLSNQIPRGRSIDLASLTYVRGSDVAVDSAGRVTFSMTARGTIATQINASQLQERLAGRGLAEAQRYLTSALDLAEDTPPQIILSPDWFGQMPLLAMRITIIEAALDASASEAGS